MTERRYLQRRSVIRSFGVLGLGTLAATLAACTRAPGGAPTPKPLLTIAPPSPTSPPPASATAMPTLAPHPTATIPPATPTPMPSPTAPLVTPSPRATPGKPQFSNVAQQTPADVLLYLQGRLSGYPEGSPQTEVNFSPSDILETMDTIVLDQIKQREGSAALQKVYDAIARDILTTLRELYANHWVLLALDAGHGGNKAFYWDPGSEGTEALHTRGVAASIQAQAQQPGFAQIIVRPIFNDAIADDFGPTAPINRPSINMTLIRQVRASMLALEAAAWNSAHPEAASQVMVHEISVHFNVGANGALVLHQGNTVRPEFVARSIDFAERYLQQVTTDLNATGLLPSPLKLWNGTGLHDDVMMYRPNGMSSPARANVVLRYGALQGVGYSPRYIAQLLGKIGQGAGVGNPGSGELALPPAAP